MRSTQHQWRILTGSISKTVGLGDGSNLAKFHAFIIKVNNSGYFWTITAGLFTLHGTYGNQTENNVNMFLIVNFFYWTFLFYCLKLRFFDRCRRCRN